MIQRASHVQCQIPDDGQTKGLLYSHSEGVEIGRGFQAVLAIGHVGQFRSQMLGEGAGTGVVQEGEE